MDMETMMKTFFPQHESQAQPIPFGGTQGPFQPGPPQAMGNVMDYGSAMRQGPARNPMDASTYGVTQNTGAAAPQMPQFTDEASRTGGDVSGFANAGLTPPPIPDAQSGIMGLMKMLAGNDPHAQAKLDPQQQQQGGAIMQYLQSLGV